MTAPAHSSIRLDRYRPWFYAAALYNLGWGLLNLFLPDVYFGLLDVPTPTYLPLYQVVGMVLLVFVPAYIWAARYPERHPHIIVVAFLGKTLGPIGFLWALLTGQLPLSFGWTILMTDIVWLPAFALYLRDSARLRGGWKPLLAGR
jgi:small multidrug resistance pump